jgi:hypothetical protein
MNARYRPMKLHNLCHAALAIVITMSSAGCGGDPQLAEVTGTVTLDGKPLKDVEVRFMPDPAKGTPGLSASCYTDAQGRYTLRTGNREKRGAAVGTHRVCFVDIAAIKLPSNIARLNLGAAAETLPKAPAPGPSVRPRFPALYQNPTTTPFNNVEVKAGANKHDFDLKPNRK